MRRLASGTLRLRLIIGSLVATTVVVALLAFVGYSVVRADVLGDVDDDLVEQSRRVPPDLRGRPRGGSPFGSNVMPRQGRQGRPDFGRGVFVAQLTDADGDVITQTDGAASIGGLPKPRLEPGPREAAYRTVTVDDERYRVLEVAQRSTVLQLGAPLDRADDFLRRLRLLLAPALVISALLTVMASLAVARLTLRPIEGMTRTAKRMRETGDLDERVEPAFRDAEFVEFSDALGEMLGSVAASHDAQRQFIADASHELRTPLTSLRGNADFLARQARSGDTLHGSGAGSTDRAGDVDEASAALLRDVDRIAELADGLTTLARLDAAPAAHLEPVDVAAVVSECATRARSAHPNFTVATDVDGHVGTAMLDRELLLRITSNLLDNACRYSQDSGDVRVAVRRLGDDALELVVEDAGPGLATSDLTRAFERFHRAGTSSGVRGTGLGLAIVRQSARALGGDAVLERREPTGLRCRVTLVDRHGG